MYIKKQIKFTLVLLSGLVINTVSFAINSKKSSSKSSNGKTDAFITGAAVGVAAIPGAKFAYNQYLYKTNPGKAIVAKAKAAAMKKTGDNSKSAQEAGDGLSVNFDTELDTQIQSFFSIHFGTKLTSSELSGFKEFANISSDDSFTITAGNLTQALGNIRGTAKSVDIAPQEFLSRMRQVKGFDKGYNQVVEGPSSAAINSGTANSAPTSSDFKTSFNTTKNLSQTQTGVDYGEEERFATNLGKYARNLGNSLSEGASVTANIVTTSRNKTSATTEDVVDPTTTGDEAPIEVEG
jgi:hypothetical protein